MSNLCDQLETAIKKQPTSESQYILLKAVLDHYSPYKELGECALDICHRLTNRDLQAAKIIGNIVESNESAFSSIHFLNLLYEKSPSYQEEAEEPEEGDMDEWNPPDEWEPDYKSGYDRRIEALVEFCSYGVELHDALERIGLKWDPPKP